MKTLFLVMCIVGSLLFPPHSISENQIQHYKHESVPFEVEYPLGLIASTTFLRITTETPSMYPVVSIGRSGDPDFFVSISPKSHSFKEITDHGYGSADRAVGIIEVGGHEAVLLKQLVGDPPYELEKDGFEVYLSRNNLEYYFIISSETGKAILDSLRFTD